ncbi:LPXTG cell wall anchor domain-containing protein, partial [Streptomyces sp. F8]
PSVSTPSTSGQDGNSASPSAAPSAAPSASPSAAGGGARPSASPSSPAAAPGAGEGAELAHTGSSATTVAMGAAATGLVLAGAGALYAVRRRANS